MNKLVYKFVKTYGDGFNASEVNYLCKDKYVHVRLRRFGDKVERISGFEDKLTFLLTLLMQEKVKDIVYISQIDVWNDKSKSQELWKECVSNLKSSKEYKDLECVISTVLEGFKGIKILPMYSLKHRPENTFELLGGCNNMWGRDLSYILDTDFYGFADIYEFLFDNNVEVYVEKESIVDDSKYINKYKEKDVRCNLWEM